MNDNSVQTTEFACQESTCQDLATCVAQPDVQVDVQANDQLVTDSVQPKSLGPYSDMFKAAQIYLKNGQSYNLSDCYIDGCSLVDVALAILVELEVHRASPLVRSKELLSGYESVKVKYTVNNETKLYNISMEKLAKGVLNLVEKYKAQDFVDLTICRNWKWTSHTSSRNENGKYEYDPYNFSRTERDVKLGDAKMVLLVKAFRLYLIETVKRCFPKVKNPEKWDSSGATYRVNGTDRSTYVFVAYMEELFFIFNQVTKLSNNLNEYRQVVSKAIALGKREGYEKRENEYHQKRLEANFKEVSNKLATLTTSDISTGVFTGVLNNSQPAKQGSQPESGSSTVQAAPRENKWKTSEKSLVTHLVDNGMVSQEYFAKTETKLNTETDNEGHDGDKSTEHENNRDNRSGRSGRGGRGGRGNRNGKGGRGGRGFTNKSDQPASQSKSGVVKRNSTQDSTSAVTDQPQTSTTPVESSSVQQTQPSNQNQQVPKRQKKSAEQNGQNNQNNSDSLKWVTVNKKKSKPVSNSKTNTKK